MDRIGFEMDEEKKQRYVERMRRKKSVIDAAIERAQEERGIVIVITGNGKGKTTSAFGTLFRALGHGQRVGVIQFIKGKQSTGEFLFLQQCGMPVEYHAMATGFTWDSQNWDEDRKAAEETWSQAQRMLNDEQLNLVIFDELTYLLKYKFLDANVVQKAIRERPAMQNVIITGRAATPDLLELADTVSEIRDEKHAFRLGVKAQAGIDY